MVTLKELSAARLSLRGRAIAATASVLVGLLATSPAWAFALAQEVESSGAASPEIGMVFLQAPVLLIALVAGTRLLVRRRIRRLMRAMSGEQRSEVLEELQAEEVRAPRAPHFVEVDLSSQLPDAVDVREAQVAEARKLFDRAFLYDVAVAAGYAFLGSWLVKLLAAFYGFTALIRVLAFRSRFRAYVKGIIGRVRPLLEIWLTLGDPEGRFVVAAIAISVATLATLFDWLESGPSAFVGLLAPAFHIAVTARLMATARKSANLKLVVLRVFEIDGASRFTFDGLLRYWRHFGSFFTVVDSSFLKSQSRWSPPVFLAIATAIVLVGLEDEVPAFKEEPVLLWWVVLPVLLVFGAVYAYDSLRRAEKGFVRSCEDLLDRLRRLDARPRHLNLTFKSMPLMCFDNTWRVAVAECVKSADAVLVDLRGLAEHNRGCRYEVDFLLDAISVDRVVFLVDRSVVASVKELILEQWEQLRTTSPNLEALHPQVRIYVASRENAKDVQGILDSLLVAALAGTE